MHDGRASALRSPGQLAPPGQIRQRTSPASSPARALAQSASLSAFDPYAPVAEPAGPSSRVPSRQPQNFFYDDQDASDPGWGSDASGSSVGSDSKSRHPRSRARSGAEPLAGLADVLDDWDQVARRTQAKLEDWFGLPPASPDCSSRPPGGDRSADEPDDSSADQVRVLVHQVQSGDTLPGLAVRYGAPLPTLRRVNGLWDRDMTLARSVIYIPLDACTHPAPAGSTQTMLPASGASGATSSPYRSHPPPPLASSSGPGPGPPSHTSRTCPRTPVSPLSGQHGRAALPSPLLEARLAPGLPPATTVHKGPYSARPSDAYLIDLSEGSEMPRPSSPARTPASQTTSQLGPLDGDSVAAVSSRELGYFPAPLHPTPLHAGVKNSRAPDKRSDDTSRDSLDSLVRMSAARSATVRQPLGVQPQASASRTSGPLGPGARSAASDNDSQPLAPGLKPLRLSSSATARPGANLLASTNAPKPGVKVKHAYSGAASASDPDSSTWSALLAGLPPNSGPGANWARPIGLPTERPGTNATPSQGRGGANGNGAGALAWSTNDWSTLFGDTIRGRVPLDTAFQQAADKVGQDFKDWTLEPASEPPRARSGPEGRRPLPANIISSPASTSQPTTTSLPISGPSAAWLGDVPPAGTASRRRGRPPVEERIQLL